MDMIALVTVVMVTVMVVMVVVEEYWCTEAAYTDPKILARGC